MRIMRLCTGLRGVGGFCCAGETFFCCGFA